MGSRVMKGGLPKRRPDHPETSPPLYMCCPYFPVCNIISAHSLLGPSPASWRACDGVYASASSSLPPSPLSLHSPQLPTQKTYLYGNTFYSY